MLKKILGVAMILALVLGGCAKEPDMRPTYSHLEIRDFLSDDRYGYDETFLELQARAQEGEMPASVYVSWDAVDETITEETPVQDLWMTVTGFTVATEPHKIDGKPRATVSFTFAWEDGEQYTFRFLPWDVNYYLTDAKEEFHRVRMPDDSILPTLRAVEKYLSQPEGSRKWVPLQETIEQSQNKRPGSFRDFTWDMDGDGKEEQFYTEFHERYPSGDLVIYLSGNGELREVLFLEASDYPFELEKGEDEQGPYLAFSYINRFFMEEYTLEDTNRIILRYEDGEFTGDQTFLGEIVVDYGD